MNYLIYLKKGKSINQTGEEKAIEESKNFYDKDVKYRRLRERKKMDDKQFASSIWKGIPNAEANVLGLYDPETDEISISYSLMESAKTSDDDRKRASRIISHELAHRDLYDRETEETDITDSEYKFLQKAYKGESELSEDIFEKHAFNREIRHGVYQLFIDKNNREPESIEEFDKFIKEDLKNSDIEKLMKSGSIQGEEYLKSIKDGKSTFDKVKDSLIHVAKEDTNEIQISSIGGNLNYLNYLKN